jgi:hypothetical protein
VTVGNLLNSIGYAGLFGRMSTLLLIPLVPALWLAAETGSVTAVAWVMLGHMTVGLALVMALVRSVTGTSMRRQWLSLQPVVLASAVAWGATRLTAAGLDGLAPFVELVACSAVALLVYAAAVRTFSPELLGYALAQVRRALRRGPGSADVPVEERPEHAPGRERAAAHSGGDEPLGRSG